MSDDVRVSVQWTTNTVFAGECVDCAITFKNVSLSNLRRSPSPASHIRRHGSQRERWRDSMPPNQTISTPIPNHRKHPFVVGSPPSRPKPHKTALSLGEPNGNLRYSSAPVDNATFSGKSIFGGNDHRRSVSIVSIRGDISQESPPQAQLPKTRPGQTHARAASMQTLPRINGLYSPGPSSGEWPALGYWA